MSFERTMLFVDFSPALQLSCSLLNTCCHGNADVGWAACSLTSSSQSSSQTLNPHWVFCGRLQMLVHIRNHERKCTSFTFIPCSVFSNRSKIIWNHFVHIWICCMLISHRNTQLVHVSVELNHDLMIVSQSDCQRTIIILLKVLWWIMNLWTSKTSHIYFLNVVLSRLRLSSLFSALWKRASVGQLQLRIRIISNQRFSAFSQDRFVFVMMSDRSQFNVPSPSLTSLFCYRTTFSAAHDDLSWVEDLN